MYDFQKNGKKQSKKGSPRCFYCLENRSIFYLRFEVFVKSSDSLDNKDGCEPPVISCIPVLFYTNHMKFIGQRIINESKSEICESKSYHSVPLIVYYNSFTYTYTLQLLTIHHFHRPNVIQQSFNMCKSLFLFACSYTVYH